MAVNFLDNHWYAIRTKSRCEKMVRDRLAGQGVESLLPVRRRVSQYKQRSKVIEAALFPNYCFARFRREDQELVLKTPGVVNIVRNGDTLEPLILTEIAAMQRLVQSALPYEAHAYLQEGMTVEVIRGPLAGICGKVVRNANNCRLVLSISVIRQAVAVTIQVGDIKQMSGGQAGVG